VVANRSLHSKQLELGQDVLRYSNPDRIITLSGPPGPYGIGGSCMDKITFSVLWHDRETKARFVHALYRSSRVDRITKNGVSKKK